MSFSTPLALVLLLVLPGVIAAGRPRNPFRRTRDLISLALRCTILILLILALSGVQVVRSADSLAVVFLVDASDSVGTISSQQAYDLVRAQIQQMGVNDSAGIVMFGKTPQIDRPISASTNMASGTPRSTPDSSDTDLSAAIRIALAMFPSESARRIVILSDGRQTVGDAAQAAQLAEAAGVEIDYLQLSVPDLPDVRITAFDAPTSVSEGQQFDLTVTLETDQQTPVRLDIFAGSDLIATESLILNRGETIRSLTIEAGASGFRDFTARVQAQGNSDKFYQNNQLSTFSQVIGPAKVLVVGSDSEVQYLTTALQEAGVTVERSTTGSLPVSAAGYTLYDAVMLANVPADQLSQDVMEAIQSYVRDLGGGLVVIGGPESYAPGGYYDTPLETMLPVEMRLKDQKRLPKLTIAYLIDRSGSMATDTGNGVPLIELAKAAINRSIDFLQPTDLAGVASFDSNAYWVAEFQEVGNREELRRLVGTLRPSGGTDIGAGLNLVAQDITTQASDAKHIILLSDGIANRRGLIETVRRLNNEYGVTLTSISIGVDNELMRDLAEAGNGTYRLAASPQSIPAIFAQETVLATRSYIFESAFTPSLTARSPIMDGITSLPTLQGYVGASEKTASQVILRGPEPYQDPILTVWQYGLGRAMAFNGDATSRWGADWVAWGDFARFWGQAVRWTMTDTNTQGVESRIVMEGSQARVILDARDDSGAFLNGLGLEATVIRPDLSLERVQLRQVAPGRYEATFTPDQQGAYLLRTLGGLESENINISQTTGWVRSYPREYQGGNTASVLPRVASLTGGTGYSDGLSTAFEHTLTARGGSTSLAPWLVLFAMLLLPFDIGLRRLLITRADIQRVFGALRRSSTEVAVPSERMATLMQARDRARQEAAAEEIRSAPANTASALRARLKSDTPKPLVTPIVPSSSAPTDSASNSTPTDVTPEPALLKTEGENLGTRLLKRKKDRQGE
jgi:uncharacterized membrane protein